jgi:hypothetical protein
VFRVSSKNSAFERTVTAQQGMEWIGARTEDGVGGIHGDLVLGGVADEPLGVGEGDIGRRGAVPLVVGDDLDAVVLPHADARVGRAEVDTNGRTPALRHCFRSKRGSLEL